MCEGSGGNFSGHTVGYELEQNTVYFLITPFSLSGGSQETNTTELDAAAAFTPPGGPGTGGKKKNLYQSWYNCEWKKKQLTEDAFIFCEVFFFFLRKHCMIFAETCILKKVQIFQRGAWTPVIAAYS